VVIEDEKKRLIEKLKWFSFTVESEVID